MKKCSDKWLIGKLKLDENLPYALHEGVKRTGSIAPLIYGRNSRWRRIIMYTALPIYWTVYSAGIKVQRTDTELVLAANK